MAFRSWRFRRVNACPELGESRLPLQGQPLRPARERRRCHLPDMCGLEAKRSAFGLQGGGSAEVMLIEAVRLWRHLPPRSRPALILELVDGARMNLVQDFERLDGFALDVDAPAVGCCRSWLRTKSVWNESYKMVGTRGAEVTMRVGGWLSGGCRAGLTLKGKIIAGCPPNSAAGARFQSTLKSSVYLTSLLFGSLSFASASSWRSKKSNWVRIFGIVLGSSGTRPLRKFDGLAIGVCTIHEGIVT